MIGTAAREPPAGGNKSQFAISAAARFARGGGADLA